MTEKENLVEQLVDIAWREWQDELPLACSADWEGKVKQKARDSLGKYSTTIQLFITTHTEEAVASLPLTEIIRLKNKHATPEERTRWLKNIQNGLQVGRESDEQELREALAVRTEECAEIVNQCYEKRHTMFKDDMLAMILRNLRSLSPNHTEALRSIEERAKEPYKLKLSRIVGILSMPAPGRMSCPFCKSSVNPMPGMPDGLVLAHQDSCIIEEARAILAEGKEKE